MNPDKFIVNAALTGCVASKADNPNLPVHPYEVADDAVRCASEGATVFHLHARDAKGTPLYGKAAYGWYVDAVRAAVPGAIICASTSGRQFRKFERRAAAILSGPDLASLSLGSVDFPNGDYSENGLGTVKGLLKLMRREGVRPEFEAFDLGHVLRLAEVADGPDARPHYVNAILGVHLPASGDMARLMARHLEGWTVWAVAGVGRYCLEMALWSLEHGGQVRVGLEDCLWMDRDDPATNARLVRHVVNVGRALGREPATFAEAREALGL